MNANGPSLFDDPAPGLGAVSAGSRGSLERRRGWPISIAGPAWGRPGDSSSATWPKDSSPRSAASSMASRRARRPAGLGIRRDRDGDGRLGAAAALDRAGPDALALPPDLHPPSARGGDDPGLALALRDQPGQGEFTRADARAEPGVPRALESPHQPVAPEDPGRRSHAPLARRAG